MHFFLLAAPIPLSDIETILVSTLICFRRRLGTIPHGRSYVPVGGDFKTGKELIG